MTASRDVRKALRAHSDGMTRQELCAETGRLYWAVCHALKTMPDVYIDRWQREAGKQWSAVYCAVVPPENCPRPTKEKS